MKFSVLFGFLFGAFLFTIPGGIALASTPFETLALRYQQGERPNLSDLTGAYAGRCFYSSLVSPEQEPVSMLMIGRRPPGAPDAGPLFPPTVPTRFQVHVFQDAAQPQRPFEDLTQGEAFEADRETGIVSTEVVAANAELTWRSDYGLSGPSLQFEARRDATYTYLKLTYLKDVDPQVKAGQLAGYCYFFKKLP